MAGEFFGSCVTFGAGGQASAPGPASGKAAGRNTSYFTSKCGLTLNLKCDIVENIVK